MAFGFFAIAVVTLAFFLKPCFFDKEINQESKDGASQNEELDFQGYNSLTDADLLKKINKRETLAIIDIRNADSFGQEHIAGSKNILPENLESDLSSLDKDNPCVIIDNLGLDPMEIQVMKQLREKGFSDVAYLEGGFSQWKNQLNPTITSGDPYSFTDQSKVTYLKSDELKNIISQEPNLYLIDLRKSSQFVSGHLKEAVNIYLEDLESRYREIPIGKKIILYDDNGFGAFQGAVRLFDLGVTNVFALSDGLDVWKQKGFEVAK